MRDFLSITKALSDPSRVRTLLMLGDRELCVCQITEVLGLAPSTVSKHLAILAQAGLIETRKEGRWIHCRLPAGKAHSPIARDALAWVKRAFIRDRSLAQDRKRLRAVLCLDAAAVCRKQTRRSGPPRRSVTAKVCRLPHAGT